MDIIELYQSYDIDYKTDGHKHCRPGWVNVPCPFCTGNPGYHLGATLDGSHFYCWRCGWKPTNTAISKLLKITFKQANSLIEQFGGVYSYSPIKEQVATKEFRFPSNLEYLTGTHRRYLESRDFDPKHLQYHWDILSTGPLSLVDGINYSHRILIPIYWNFQPVTFQTRDISDKSKFKYIACPKARELIHHKHILYGRPEKWKSTGICVEGVTDVWRMGIYSFATFGIEYTQKQVTEMAKRFNRVAVMFDFEPQAQKKADSLISELKFRGVDAFKVPVENDPGSLSQNEADYIVKQIF